MHESCLALNTHILADAQGCTLPIETLLPAPGAVCTAVLPLAGTGAGPAQLRTNIWCGDLKALGSSTSVCRCERVPGLRHGSNAKSVFCQSCFGESMAQVPADGSGVGRAQTMGRLWAMLFNACKVTLKPTLSERNTKPQTLSPKPATPSPIL